MNRRIHTLFFLVLLATGSVFADDAADKFKAAQSAFDLKQFEQAREGFNAFLTQFPQHAQYNEAMFYLAESLLNTKQYAQAESYYNRLVLLGLNNQFARFALFRLCDIPYIQGNFDVAKPRLEEFIDKLDRDSSLQFVLYDLGDIAMRRNVPEEAEHYFKQAVEMFPQGARYVESQIGLAWAKNQLGKRTEANDIFQTLMSSTDPKVVEPAVYQWGVALFERGDYQEAINTLTDFRTRFPGSSFYNDSLRVIARCKGRLENYDEAIQILSQIPQPTIDDHLMNVRLLYALKRSQDAYDLLLSTERAAGPIYRDEIALLKSVFLYDQKKWTECISLLESLLLPHYDALSDGMRFNYAATSNSAVNKLPDDSFLRACSLLALSYARNGQNDKADAALREIQNQAAQLNGTDLQSIVSDTHGRLSAIYAEGNLPLAPIATYPENRPNRPDYGYRPNRPYPNQPGHFPNRPDNPKGQGNDEPMNPAPDTALTVIEARRALRDAHNQFSSGRFTQADTTLRNLIARNPEENVKADAILLRSKTVFKLGRDPEAVVLLESLLDEFPSSAQTAEALWHLGFYYFETCGDSVNAVRYFQQLTEQFPNSKNVDGALYYVALDDLENGNSRTATANLTRIFRNYSDKRYWSHAVWTLAYQAYRKRDYAQADIYVQKLLNHPPDIAVLDRVLYLKGALALRKNEYDTAFVAFREVGKLCPDSPLYDSATQNARLAAGKVTTATR